jgi:hypothetical protein
MMSPDHIIRITELGLIRAIPEMLADGQVKNGRLRGLFRKLQKAVDGEFAVLPLVTDADMLVIKGLLDNFGAVTGWVRSDKHISTLLSFCLEMLERRRFNHNPRITQILGDIADYHMRKQDFKTVCCKAGVIAADKFDAVCNQMFHNIKEIEQ